MLSETADGLYCPAGDFFIDPWNPVISARLTGFQGSMKTSPGGQYNPSAVSRSITLSF